MTLSAEAILKADDTGERVRVDVPEWGGFVFVGMMTGAERDRWEISTSNALEKPGTANVRASLCAATMCDETGKRIFTPNQANDLGRKSAAALDRVYTAARKLNKVSEGDIEELEKN